MMPYWNVVYRQPLLFLFGVICSSRRSSLKFGFLALRQPWVLGINLNQVVTADVIMTSSDRYSMNSDRYLYPYEIWELEPVCYNTMTTGSQIWYVVRRLYIVLAYYHVPNMGLCGLVSWFAIA